MSSPLPVILSLLAHPILSIAYNWKFDSTPQQCSNLTISVSGTDGKPPYRILLVPFGPSQLPNNTEVRKIIDQPFPGDSTTVSFRLNYPANSQYVAVVSDASGFGSGGTSVAVSVTSSSDNSCFDPKTNVAPEFVFSLEPVNQVVQCESTRIWWDPSANVRGTPNFLGVIPGGQSFAIPQSQTSTVPQQGLGFSWTPSIRGGTTLIIVGGDSRGNGTGGSALNTVSSGIRNINDCLNDNSPSSTPGSPAGGAYPTSSTGSGTGPNPDSNGSSSSKSSNVGAIVGGVIGGVVALVALALLLLFFHRRKRVNNKQKERPVDLLNEDDEEAPGHGNTRNDLPEYYQPEPFTVPDPTVASTYDGETTALTSSEGRPLSGYTTTSRSGTPDPSGSSSAAGRKGPMRQMRPINIIQHDDAGPSEEAKAEEAETVELPPAYTNIRR